MWQTVGSRSSKHNARKPRCRASLLVEPASPDRRRIAGGDLAIIRRVLLNIAVEEIEWRSADLHIPNLGVDFRPGYSISTRTGSPACYVAVRTPCCRSRFQDNVPAASHPHSGTGESILADTSSRRQSAECEIAADLRWSPASKPKPPE